MPELNINLNGNKLILTFNYNPPLVAVLKDKLPFNLRKFKQEPPAWEVYLINQAAIDYFYSFLESAKALAMINIDPLAKAFIVQKHNEFTVGVKLSQGMNSSIDPKRIDLAMTIREYQRTAIEYIANHKHTFLADPVGTGKTVETLGTLQYLKGYPALIVMPSVAIRQWQNEIDKWLGKRRSYTILHTDNKNIDLKADIILTTYDMTKKYLMELKQIPFKALILDESHYVKGKKTQRFNAISEIAKDKEITVLISATPLDRPSDLIAQLEIMGTFKPLFQSWKYFVERYCDAKKTRFGMDMSGASNVSELKDILRANCMIARDKKEIMPELPDTTRIPFTMPLSERYAELYSKTLDDISEWYYEKSRNNLISQIVDGNLTPAQLMAIETQAVKNAGRKPSIQAEALVRLNALRQISGIGKLETIKEWIDNFKETGEKLVIFVYHKPVMAKLLSLYPSSAFIDGSLSAENKGKQILKFWHDKGTQFIICAIKASGVSIDLQNASNALFIEMWWTATAHIQCEGRLERHGQKNAMNMYYAIAEDNLPEKTSIDRRIYDIVEEKRKTVDSFKAKTGVKDILGILKNIVEKK